MKCNECGVPISVNKTELGDISVDEEFIKFQSHMLWYHPTVQDEMDLVDSISELFDDLMYSFANMEAMKTKNISIDMIDKLMRLKKYMEMELQNEIS